MRRAEELNMSLDKFRGAVARSFAIAALIALATACTPVTVEQREPCVGRRDTPWCPMSDAELAAAVDSAGGRVFIGFKDPDAAAGVDEKGRVLANPESVLAGKKFLRSLDIVFTWESADMPMLVGVMPGKLVGQVRANPFIEYIEPIFPGTRFGQ